MAENFRDVQLYTPNGHCYTRRFFRNGDMEVVA
jgi:hypothetical protein